MPPREWTQAEIALVQEVAEQLEAAIARAGAGPTTGSTRYRALVEAMDEAVCVFERLPLRPDGLRDYRYITMNPAMQAMFGIPDLSGQSIRDNFPDEVEDWYDDYDRVLETGEAIRFERGSIPQGMVLEMFVARIEDGSGRSLMAVIRDITWRRIDDNTLREREARQELLLRFSDRLRTLAAGPDVMRAACALLGEALGVDRVNYAEVEGEDFIIAHEHHREGLASMAGRYPASGPKTAERAALEAGRTVVIADVDAEPGLRPDQREVFRAWGVRAFVSVPLVKEERLVAVLSVIRSRAAPWRLHEVELVGEVAERTWAAVARVRSEKALRESEEKFRSLFETMTQGYCECELVRDESGGVIDCRLLEMNPAFERLTGLSAAQARGRAVTEVLHRAKPWWVKEFAEMVSDRRPRTIEREVPEQGRWYEIRAYHRDGDRFAALFSDTTERKRIDAALQASETRLRALVNATSEVVYRMSPDWQVMWELDGRGFVKDTHEATSDWLFAYIPAEDQPEVTAAIRQAIETKGVFQLEHRVKRPDGTLGWMFSRAIPLLDEAGEIVEWFGAASDVTPRRQAVEALAHTQRLKAVGRLAGAIAHDFNNLLTVIIANIELSEMRERAEEKTQFLDKALKAAQLGERLNQRLLTWAGQAPMQPKEVILNDLVTETGAILDRSIGERFTLSLDLAPDLWPCFIDPANVDSMVLNLVVNARDAMPDGGEIRLSTANVPAAEVPVQPGAAAAPGDHVCLCISDDGFGMSEEVRRRAFEAFFSTKEQGTGVGLGLFSVKTVVQQSGGFLEFDSAPGRGTTFRLYFPRTSGARDVTPLTEADTRQPPAPLTHPLILVVEDQKAVRDATRERLQSLGYSVVEAADAEEALGILRWQRDIRVVFSDVVMPGEMSGRDLAKRVLHDFPGVEVLLTAGYIAETSPKGVDDPTANVPVLIKPYRLHDLAAALRSLLAAHHTGTGG
ncbi:PAS domain S-box protein [Yangia mangrovi]|uniref:histidine kinase n=2 Tax=Alloyangia mangrovi TaxID=1779329 RepID=A0ABT2KNN0_9RHOB|nr:PAS domain S-box protein [Alloyangia mangrovi]